MNIRPYGWLNASLHTSLHDSLDEIVQLGAIFETSEPFKQAAKAGAVRKAALLGPLAILDLSQAPRMQYCQRISSHDIHLFDILVRIYCRR